MICCNYKKLPSLVCLLWLTVSAYATDDEQSSPLRAWSGEIPRILPDLHGDEKFYFMNQRPEPHAPIRSGGRLASIGRYDSQSNMLLNYMSNHLVEGSYDSSGMFDGGLDEGSAASPIKIPPPIEKGKVEEKVAKVPERTLLEKPPKKNT